MGNMRHKHVMGTSTTLTGCTSGPQGCLHWGVPHCPALPVAAAASQMAPAQLLPLLRKLQQGLPITVVALGGSVVADYGGECPGEVSPPLDLT